MLAFILVGSAAALSLRHNDKSTALKLDPHCSEGIMNTEMTVCCMKDCGECSDTSNLCSASRQEEMGKDPQGRESTCCPSAMTEVPSCTVSMAPCAIPEEVRNPPTLDSLKASEVHAKDDCGEVIKATSDSNHLNTAYIKLPEKGVASSVTTKDCGTYGTLIQAASACSNDDDCFGFNAKPDGDATKPDCLYVASTAIEKTSDTSGQDLYMKVEEQFTGHKYELRVSPCTKKCGGGVHTPVCKSQSGTTAKLGLCSAMVAMNADAELEESECHKQTCDPEKVNVYKQEPPYKKCFEQEVEIQSYYYWHFTSDGYIQTRDWEQRNWMGTGQRGDGYYDLMAYAGDYKEDRILFTEEEVIGNENPLDGAGSSVALADGTTGDFPIQAVFTCPEDGGVNINYRWHKVENTDYAQGYAWRWDGTYEFIHPCACAEK